MTDGPLDGDRPPRPRRRPNGLSRRLDQVLTDLGREVENTIVADGPESAPMTLSVWRRLRPSVERATGSVYPLEQGASSTLESLITESTLQSWVDLLTGEGTRMREVLGEQLAAAVARQDADAAQLLEMASASIDRRLAMARRYDDTTTWQDRRGYVLSDRIWAAGQSVRQQIDRRVRLAIARGTDAHTLARGLRGMLTPGLAGNLGDGTYAARRLARTEITRALGQATVTVAQKNPMVRGVRWRLSARHPGHDICDEHATANRFDLGPGIYPTDQVPRYPPHPMCLCVLVPSVPSRAEAVEEIRRKYGLDDPSRINPYNPAVVRGADGNWGSDTIPLTDWEAPEHRVVLPSDLQRVLAVPVPVLRWARSKRAKVEEDHHQPIEVRQRQDIAATLSGWERAGPQPGRSGTWHIFFRDEGRWTIAVMSRDQVGSFNFVTMYRPASGNQLRNMIRRGNYTVRPGFEGDVE